MKLLVFIYSLSSGGAERVTVNLCNYWAEAGWHITIVTFTGKEKDFYELHPAVNRIALGLDDPSTNIFKAIKNNLFRLNAIRKLIRNRDPDVAIGMMTTTNCLLALASIGTNIRTIGSERTYPPMLPLNKMWKFLRRYSYVFLDVVTALTEEGANWIKKNTWYQEVVIMPNPVSYPIQVKKPILYPVKFKKSKKYDKVLLAVGRLVEAKAFERLISAFSKLKDEFPEWGLVILGEGKKRVFLEQKIQELGLDKKVFLPGRVGNVGDWYTEADIYVLTSRFEGFPNTLAEALSYGLPAVAVNCKTGPKDILRSGIDGILIPQHDEPALIDGLKRLMKDEKLRKEYSQNAIDVRERFSIKKISLKWQNLFDEVLRR